MKSDFAQPPLRDIDPSWKIGIVHSTFHKEEMDALVESAKASLISHGISEEHIIIQEVPGSFEIPLLGAALAKNGSVDALIGLGIIVEGDTEHARLIAESVAKGIMDVQVRECIPFAFEVLHVHSLDQARKRLNKGEEAAYAVLHSLAQLTSLQS